MVAASPAPTAPPQGLFSLSSQSTVRYIAAVDHAHRPCHNAADRWRGTRERRALLRRPAASRRRSPAYHRAAAGTGGNLLEQARAGGVPIALVDELQRPINPWRDLVSYVRIKSRCSAIFGPMSFIRTAPKAAFSAARRPGRSERRPLFTRCMGRRFIRSRAGGRNSIARHASAGPRGDVMPWLAWPTP